MDLEEEAIPRLFLREGSSDRRRTSLTSLMLYETLAMVDELPPAISLEKMSLALHHLLTGEFRLVGSPLSRAILGGSAFRVNLGDGPARYLWAEEVREISTALESVTQDDLWRRYDPSSLKAAWPMTPVDAREDDKRVFYELESYFQLLVAYYRIAAARGNAMLIGLI